MHGTPCVAFQIVDGKCRVLREKWFDTRYGTGGLGLRTSGNLVSSTAQGGGDERCDDGCDDGFD